MTTAALQSIIRCSVSPIVDGRGTSGSRGRFASACREKIEFAPSVSESRKTKKRMRGGKDQSGSHVEMWSVAQRITGSAFPRSTIRTNTSGTDSRVPLIIDLAFGDELMRGALATS